MEPLTCDRCGARAAMVLPKHHLARCTACGALIDACPQLGCEDRRELPDEVDGIERFKREPLGLSWKHPTITRETIGLGVTLLAVGSVVALLVSPGWILAVYPFGVVYLAAVHIFHRDNQLEVDADTLAWQPGGILPRAWRELARADIDDVYCTVPRPGRYRVAVHRRDGADVVLADGLEDAEQALFLRGHVAQALALPQLSGGDD